MMARIDETGEWVRCGCCGQKLFKMIYADNVMIEIKCRSCKSINVMWTIEGDVVRQSSEGE